jgi:hypothetical protein
MRMIGRKISAMRMRMSVATATRTTTRTTRTTARGDARRPAVWYARPVQRVERNVPRLVEPGDTLCHPVADGPHARVAYVNCAIPDFR